MSAAAASQDVVHNAEAHRFEVILDGELARVDYRLDGNVMRLVHTEVPAAHEGKGVAGALVRAAMAYARARDLRVLPACSYVRSYMQHHPETHDLLPPGTTL
ncbi:MAG: GNAT family N-acetyltransferase [Casimicrobiaceae bacterium]|jgi:predicted GNAT family acetyltransferase